GENLEADGFVDFRQRREVEFLAEQLHEGRAQFARQRLDQVAGFGDVEIAGQLAQPPGILRLDGGDDRRHVIAEDGAFLVIDSGRGRLVSRIFVELAHAGLHSGAAAPAPCRAFWPRVKTPGVSREAVSGMQCAGSREGARLPGMESTAQLRSRSTSLLAEIHGIMARSRSPTSSIGCESFMRRMP